MPMPAGRCSPKVVHDRLAVARRVNLGLAWAESHLFNTGPCPVLPYHRQLMSAILSGCTNIVRDVDATLIPRDEGRGP